ncbi:MAG: tRNA (adenosine(37)-N6)-threonylcarbamoyltransferase complex ATPase subunit type 1 TsaE [Myxococcales bacterium FL481]|nr:MAG: tRNA (adenosine(37)-N6)-threonylcarbamoyltransferase complex ATPase subunit type 1 TsaE [Myxococcales bacterium FL481]
MRTVVVSESGLHRFGEQLGAVLRSGDVVLLDGPMGAGKTTLTRAIARGLAVHDPEAVCSPTFTLAMRHDGPHPLLHVDLCRLDGSFGDGAAALEALGLEHDELVSTRHVLVVEWAELWADAPAHALSVRIARNPQRTEVRDVCLAAGGPAWAGRVGELRDGLNALDGH